MVTGLTIMTLSQIVRCFLRGSEPYFHFRPDFRNKFGALHQSYTPNRERELYSRTRVFAFRWELIGSTRIVHLTSVTDTRRTHTIISSGELTLGHRFASVTHRLPSSRLHFEIELEDGRLHVILPLYQHLVPATHFVLNRSMGSSFLFIAIFAVITQHQ